MISRALTLTMLCAGLVLLTAPTAEAIGKKGCSAQCNKGSCSSGNTYAECGCCGDGTPYCGSASNCKDKLASSFTLVAFDVISVGGAESAKVFSASLRIALQPTEGSAGFIESVDRLAEAILSGDVKAAEAAQLITIERFEDLEEGDDVVALKVALNSLSSSSR